MAEVLRARGHEVMLFVSEKEIDALALSGRSDFRFHKLPTVGLPSPFSPAILGFLRRFNESLSLCRGIYRKFKPHVVLGMGGFTSTAPVLAGKMRGIPTFIHESNAIPGKANRLTARMVRAVLLGFKECAPFFPKVRTEVTGTPIRKELQRLDRKIARQRLGLREDLLTLLVMGGSQGASGINQAMIKSLPALQGAPFQVIHLAGARDERLVADNYQREKIPAHVAAFHHAMEEVYSAADFAIARSGAASLAELAAFSLPAILIPVSLRRRGPPNPERRDFCSRRGRPHPEGIRSRGRSARAQNPGVNRRPEQTAAHVGKFRAPGAEKRSRPRRRNDGKIYATKS